MKFADPTTSAAQSQMPVCCGNDVQLSPHTTPSTAGRRQPLRCVMMTMTEITNKTSKSYYWHLFCSVIRKATRRKRSMVSFLSGSSFGWSFSRRFPEEFPTPDAQEGNEELLSAFHCLHQSISSEDPFRDCACSGTSKKLIP
ncbi:hypothetical protein AVEN_53362-1 [Araneus ventricosus]|uniref:Uncharacterized protein n=1 Tax=Araneus ventricosus TaxID=182803 RepID=A0A4Y2ABG3_ARAVE|nr:hypothetical protein AVEN_53362-1 [Araneus ventricosus]